MPGAAAVADDYFAALASRDVEAMTHAVAAAAAQLGGINRIVLGHADPLTGDVRAQLERAASA